ncbi:MAG: Site-specific tyrosine recombinase XerC, partial [uncultured Sphingomonas sp.]
GRPTSDRGHGGGAGRSLRRSPGARPPPQPAYGPCLSGDRAPLHRLHGPASRRGDRPLRAVDGCPGRPSGLSRCAPRRRARPVVGGARAVGGARLSAVRRRGVGRAAAASADPRPQTAAHSAAARVTRRRHGFGRGRRRGRESAMDRCARPRGAAAALRLRPADRRSHVADRQGAAARLHAASDRQAQQAAGGAPHPRGARGDRRLCEAMPVADPRQLAAVPRCTGRSAQPRLGPPRRPDRPPPSRPARHAHAPRAAAQLRHPPAGTRRRPPLAAGTAGPRQPVVHANLHGRGRGAVARRLPPRPSAGL